MGSQTIQVSTRLRWLSMAEVVASAVKDHWRQGGGHAYSWLVVWNILYISLHIHMLRIIIPIDLHIFQRGRDQPPTSHSLRPLQSCPKRLSGVLRVPWQAGHEATRSPGQRRPVRMGHGSAGSAWINKGSPIIIYIHAYIHNYI